MGWELVPKITIKIWDLGLFPPKKSQDFELVTLDQSQMEFLGGVWVIKCLENFGSQKKRENTTQNSIKKLGFGGFPKKIPGFWGWGGVGSQNYHKNLAFGAFPPQKIWDLEVGSQKPKIPIEILDSGLFPKKISRILSWGGVGSSGSIPDGILGGFGS